MGKLLEYIAEETQGACFTSFKYCYDTEKTHQNFFNSI